MKSRVLLLFFSFFIMINLVNAREQVTFSGCVDGDTIKVLIDEMEYTVRMLAVDTPESVHPSKGVEYYGKEASEYTCKMVSNAKKIELEYDADSDKTDKYDRLLAWVFVDDKLLQGLLVENGYAKIAYLYGDYKYTSQLEELQELASAKEIGIWDENAKNNFSVDSDSSDNDELEYSNKDIVIIVILLLIFVFIGNKSIKKKAQKKLKKYLK